MNPIVHVVYRVSDKGHNAQKLKLPNAEKRSCLLNAIEQFGRENIYVIADNCSQDFTDFIKSEGLAFEETHLGNSLHSSTPLRRSSTHTVIMMWSTCSKMTTSTFPAARSSSLKA